jgi:WD40 repeat protein
MKASINIFLFFAALPLFCAWTNHGGGIESIDVGGGGAFQYVVSEDSSCIFTIGADNRLKKWDLASGELLEDTSAIRKSFSSDLFKNTQFLSSDGLTYINIISFNSNMDGMGNLYIYIYDLYNHNLLETIEYDEPRKENSTCKPLRLKYVDYILSEKQLNVIYELDYYLDFGNSIIIPVK